MDLAARFFRRLTPSRRRFPVFLLLLTCVLLVSGCTRAVPERKITFRLVTGPLPRTERVYVTGNQKELGDWKPDAVELARTADTLYARTFAFPDGTNLEFKFTRGNWNKELISPRGAQYFNVRAHTVAADTVLTVRGTGWMDLDGGTTRLTAAEIDTNNGFFLTYGWRYHPGDDASWRAAELADSAWEVTGSSLYSGSLPLAGWPGIGWFRLHLAIDSSLYGLPLALQLYQIGASEVYLNGQLLYRFGTVATTPGGVVPFEDRNPLLIRFPAKHDQVLAVRYACFAADQFHRLGIYGGFQLHLDEMNRAVGQRTSAIRDASVSQLLLTAAPLALAFLHFLLWVFYPKLRENFYYAACLVGFAAISFTQYQFVMTESADQVVLLNRLFGIARNLTMVFGLLTFYQFRLGRQPRQAAWFAVAGIGFAVWIGLEPFGSSSRASDAFMGVAILEMLRGTFGKGPGESGGGWIVGAGFMFLAATLIYQLLISYNIIPVLWGIRAAYAYGMFVLSISMSVFLSWRFGRAHKNLEVQLETVKTLSARALVQEREAGKAMLERKLLEQDNERKTAELEEARKLQLSMLPRQIPQAGGCDIAVHMKTATEVGGDYYDFHCAEDGTLTVVVGDATGHGVRAGMLVAVIKGLFHEFVRLESIPRIFDRCSRIIKGMNLGGLYMGMTVVKISGSSVRASAAGMPPLFILRNAGGAVEEIAFKSMPVGAFLDFPYEEKQLTLGPGDALILMTDGFPEMFNPQREVLDYPRVRTILGEIRERRAAAIVEHLVAAGAAWAGGQAQADDVTFVVLRAMKGEGV